MTSAHLGTAAWLFERLAERPSEPALVFRGTLSTYGELLERTAFWEAELGRQSVGAGSVVAIEGSFSPNAVGLLLAIIRLGAVAVPLTPLSRVHRPKFEAIAEAQCSILFDEADQWTVATHDRSVTNALMQKLIARRHPGLVIFSSGSTGEPKAVLHDFAALLEKFRRPGV